MYKKFTKRLLDLLFSLAALIVLSPILVILTAVTAVAMRGNPFFVQPRAGKQGKNGEEKIFKLIKFRTMSNQRGADGALLPDAARLGKYGKIMRALSLDELPELFNICLGHMSIVGPRPLLVKYLPLYTEKQRQRHKVRPGLTGLAQVNGRNAISWEEKFDLDLEYIENITFLSDCRIFFQTIKKVICHEGISSQTSVTMEEFKGTLVKEAQTGDEPSAQR